MLGIGYRTGVVCHAGAVLRRIWRLRPFLAVGAAAVIIVHGDTSVDVPDLRSYADAPVVRSEAPVPEGPTLVAVGPSRLLDTRTTGALAAGATVPVAVLGRLGVPGEHVAGVVLSVSVLGATRPTTVSIGPSGGPVTELVEAHPGSDAAAVVTTTVGPDGAITVANADGDVQVVVDVAAYVVERP